MRCSTNIIRWPRVSFFNCRPTSITKTRKKSARRPSSPSCETWHHFRKEFFSNVATACGREQGAGFPRKSRARNAVAAWSILARWRARERANRTAIAMSRAGTVVINAETSRLIRQSLDQLEDPCREIIELRYYGELSYGEIAAELRLNPKTVSSRLSKCLDRLCVIAKKIFPSEHLFTV